MSDDKPRNIELSVAILKAAAEHRYTDGLEMYVAEKLRQAGNNAFHKLLADFADPRRKTGLVLSFHAVGKAPRRRASRPLQCAMGLVPRVEIARLVFERLGRPGVGEGIARGKKKDAVMLASQHFGISAKVVRDCFSQWWRRLANEKFLREALGNQESDD